MSRSISIALGLSLCFLPLSKAGEAKVPVEYTYEEESGLASALQIDTWIVQMDVGYNNLPLGIDQDLFIGFDDILDNVDWLIPLSADFRINRLGFHPSLLAMKLTGGGATPQGVLFNRLGYDMKMAVINLPMYYRLVDQEDLEVDILGGARYLGINLEVGLTGGVLGNRIGATTAGVNADVLDGIVGLRIHQEINDSWVYQIYGDVGTGSSDLTWQVIGDVGYRVRDDLTVSLGYRYLSYSESSPASAVDISASGPQIRIRWDF